MNPDPARLRALTSFLLLLVLWLGPAAAEAKKKSKPERLTLEQVMERLPRRVADPQNREGDMVNFLLLGSKEKVKKAFEAAGWAKVDRTKKEAALRALWNTYRKKPYTELPMSSLYLFGRAQDYGYAHAEPIRVVAERHHFRLWKAPWKTTEGQEIWVGAGTHDLGFEKDERTGKLTHRIDPEVDRERDFIGETLEAAGRVAGKGYALPPNPVREATTAHGGPYRSDGQILILVLK